MDQHHTSISPCGQYKAIVKQEIEWLEPSDSYYTMTIVELHNNVTKEKKELLYARNYNVKKITFNTDSTYLIVEGPHYRDLSRHGFNYNIKTGVGILFFK